MPEASVELNEAVALAHALVSSVAKAEALRVIFVKGPGCALQGLRAAGTLSSDVDAWEDPTQRGQLAGHLVARGWLERPKSDLDNFYPVHSRTFYHPQWPCDIDVHSRFPGMDKEPALVFDALWSRRTTVTIAHQTVCVPDEEDHALILALHSLRTPWNQKGHRELEYLLDQEQVSLRFSPLYERAQETGAAGSARPFLLRLPDAQPQSAWPPPSDEWLLRTTARSPGSLRLIDILKSPWHRRPRLALNAIFPRSETLTARNLHLAVNEPRTRRSAQLARLRGGLTAIPSALHETRLYLRLKRSWRE